MSRELNSLYEPREAILRRVFAIRHMLLEEIKHRRFGLKATPNSTLDLRLVRLARGLAVERVANGYAVSVEGKVVLTLAPNELSLYVRGDQPRYVEAQATQHLRSPTTPDQALLLNRKRISEILDVLLHHIE